MQKFACRYRSKNRKNNRPTLIRPPVVKRKKYPITKIFLFFRSNGYQAFMPVGSLSDLISKRVTGKRSCTKHLLRFHHLWITQRVGRFKRVGRFSSVAGIFPAGHEQSMGSGRCKENNTLSLRPRNYVVPSCRPSQKSE